MNNFYCRRCKRDGLTLSHRCFTVFSRNPAKPLKNKPNPNTKLAQKLARIYEKEIGVPFPGGITNAKISRTKKMSSYHKSMGLCSWILITIDSSYGHSAPFGSQETATICAQDGKVVDYIRMSKIKENE